LNSKQSKQENTKQNFKFSLRKRQHDNECFCIVIESFTWSDFVAIQSWISRASLPRFGARGRWSDLCKASDSTKKDKEKKRRRRQETNENTKPKKKKNADQKENPVVGGYFIVLITAGSNQRVLNRLFVPRCEENLLLWPMKLLDLVV